MAVRMERVEQFYDDMIRATDLMGVSPRTVPGIFQTRSYAEATKEWYRSGSLSLGRTAEEDQALVDMRIGAGEHARYRLEHGTARAHFFVGTAAVDAAILAGELGMSARDIEHQVGILRRASGLDQVTLFDPHMPASQPITLRLEQPDGRETALVEHLLGFEYGTPELAGLAARNEALARSQAIDPRHNDIYLGE